MDRLILFRFHKDADLCSTRIRWLKELNPGCRVVGVGDEIDSLDKLFDAGMDGFYSLEHHDGRWCWLNGDLVISEWYDSQGFEMDFDMLHLVEWDLLYTEPLDELYEGIEEIGLTGKIGISRARELDWSWALSDDYSYLRESIGKGVEPYGCVFPGCCFCREFIEELVDMDVPELCNDESRVGILASDYDVVDTVFFDWDDSNNPLFNCNNVEPSKEDIEDSERDVFHPVRFPYELKFL
jgi:hypothetical protein